MWPTREADYTIRDFRFRTGETLATLRLHYMTLGEPHRDARGAIDNAVMVLHGTGGTGHQFLAPQFAGELYGPGQPLDIRRYWIILPDGIDHGASAKPSDGLHMRFPRYDYDDMVEAQYRLLQDGLGIRRMRLIMGTSMGCMHSLIWGEAHPDFMRALMPLACEPVELQRPDLSGRCVADIRSVAAARGDHRAGHVGQFGQRLHQPAQLRLSGGGRQTHARRAVSADPGTATPMVTARTPGRSTGNPT